MDDRLEKYLLRLKIIVGRSDAQWRGQRAGRPGHHREDRAGGRGRVRVLGHGRQHHPHQQACHRAL